MKKYLIGAVVVFILIWFMATEDQKKKASTPEPVQTEEPAKVIMDFDWEEAKALTSLLDKEEKIHRYYHSEGILYIVLTHDGSPRDGYCIYTCGLVKESGVEGVDKVVAIAAYTKGESYADTPYGATIGESSCDF